jgi:hypothetical protein
MLPARLKGLARPSTVKLLAACLYPPWLWNRIVISQTPSTSCITALWLTCAFWQVALALPIGFLQPHISFALLDNSGIVKLTLLQVFFCCVTPYWAMFCFTATVPRSAVTVRKSIPLFYTLSMPVFASVLGISTILMLRGYDLLTAIAFCGGMFYWTYGVHYAVRRNVTYSTYSARVYPSHIVGIVVIPAIVGCLCFFAVLLFETIG